MTTSSALIIPAKGKVVTTVEYAVMLSGVGIDPVVSTVHMSNQEDFNCLFLTIENDFASSAISSIEVDFDELSSSDEDVAWEDKHWSDSEVFSTERPEDSPHRLTLNGADGVGACQLTFTLVSHGSDELAVTAKYEAEKATAVEEYKESLIAEYGVTEAEITFILRAAKAQSLAHYAGERGHAELVELIKELKGL